MKNIPLIISFFFFLLLTACGRQEDQTYQGYVEGENLYLACPTEGILVDKKIARGQRVKKGELLFQLDPNPEKLLLDQLKATVTEAKASLYDLVKPRRIPEIDAIVDQIAQVDANLELADIRVKRYRELYKKQAAALDSVDEELSLQRGLQASKSMYQANLALAKLGAREDLIKSQRAKVLEMKAARSLGEWKIDQKSRKAPADGVIFDTYYQEGEFVSAGKPVAALLPFTSIRVEFFVPARALSTIHLNQKIQFTCDGCAKSNQAVISYISPEAEYVPPLVYTRDNMDSLVFRVKAQITNPMTFKPGQPVMIVGFDHGA